jgi:4-amino-4-deoxy-L-arabinose transferase-like glycosyltransferase
MSQKIIICSKSLSTIYNILIWSTLAVVAGFITATTLLPIVGTDGGFYLKISLDLSRGFGYYSDMNVAYNPLVLYLLSGVFRIFDAPPLYLFYVINSLIFTVISLLFFKISGYFEIMIRDRILYSLLLFLALYITEGTYVLLEPFVLLFQLIALFLLLIWAERKKMTYLLFLAGFSSFLAFFSKQYGISVAAGFIWFLYFNSPSWKQFIARLCIAASGFLIPVASVIWYFAQQDIPVNVMIQRLTGVIYLTGNDQVTGFGYNFLLFLESVGRYIAEIPLMIILIWLIYKQKRVIWNNLSILFILLAGSASVQLVFAGYRHYYQLIFPFCLLLMILLIKNAREADKERIRTLFAFATVIFLISSAWVLSGTIKYRYNLGKTQMKNTEILTRHVPAGEKVYLQGVDPGYYYMCLYDSPDHKRLSYRFPEELDPCYISRNIPSGSYIIADSRYAQREEFSIGFTQLFTLFLDKDQECIVLQKD